jgi:V8-like Glu-specific endopeptidase
LLKTTTALIAGNPAVAPLKWVGLLVFRNAKGDTFSCTAQFIAPKVLLTAAHCVRDNITGEWYDTNKMFFFLQYQNDNVRHLQGDLHRAFDWLRAKT